MTVDMRELLKAWISIKDENLKRNGMSITLKSEVNSGKDVWYNIDSKKYIGHICHWHPFQFEFSIMDIDRNEHIIIDDIEIKDEEMLLIYLDDLFFRRLCG